jgi:glutamate-1-semialdehyde aminotransferase
MAESTLVDDHSGQDTRADLGYFTSGVTTQERQIMTNFDDQHPVLDGDLTNVLVASLFDTASKVIFPPVMSDGTFQKACDTSGLLTLDYVSESYVALLGHSTPKVYAQSFEVGEPGERRH